MEGIFGGPPTSDPLTIDNGVRAYVVAGGSGRTVGYSGTIRVITLPVSRRTVYWAAFDI